MATRQCSGLLRSSFHLALDVSIRQHSFFLCWWMACPRPRHLLSVSHFCSFAVLASLVFRSHIRQAYVSSFVFCDGTWRGVFHMSDAYLVRAWTMPSYRHFMSWSQQRRSLGPKVENMSRLPLGLALKRSRHLGAWVEISCRH